MKKTLRKILSLFAVGAMLLTVAACGDSGKGETPDAVLMRGIYEKLITNDQYNDWKSAFLNTRIGEKLEGNSIVISATDGGEDGLKGDYVFRLDGDYITYTAQDKEDFSGYAVFMQFVEAVADYYKMNSTLMNGYLNGLSSYGIENKYMMLDMENGVYRLYAKEWEMKELDDLVVNDKVLQYIPSLGKDPVNPIVNCGRIIIRGYGTKTNFQMMIGEYGEKNTKLTYDSLRKYVAKVKPSGYSSFVKSYTELKEISAKNYTVSFGIDNDAARERGWTDIDGYSVMVVTFNEAG